MEHYLLEGVSVEAIRVWMERAISDGRLVFVQLYPGDETEMQLLEARSVTVNQGVVQVNLVAEGN